MQDMIANRSSRSSKHKPRIFTVPALATSKAIYSAFEVRFLICCIRTIERGSQMMTFNVAQLQALEYLCACLKEKPALYSKKRAVLAMRSALHALYFPKDTTLLAQDVFISPFLSFLAFLMLQPQGGYRTIWDIPPILSKAQFSMRLRASRHLQQSLEEHIKNSSTDPEQTPWFQ